MPIVDDLRCILGMILIDWALSILPERERVELAASIYPLSAAWRDRAMKEMTDAAR